VKYLDEKIDDDMLKEEFEKYGEIVSAKVVTKKVKSDDNTEKEIELSCGFGFVSFKKHEDAQRAVQNLNGKLIFNKPLYVAFAQRKDERKNMLISMFGARKQGRGFNDPRQQFNQYMQPMYSMQQP